MSTFRDLGRIIKLAIKETNLTTKNPEILIYIDNNEQNMENILNKIKNGEAFEVINCKAYSDVVKVEDKDTFVEWVELTIG